MISVLLATYNGERYLAAQLDSLLAQTCRDFVVYIGDDGSTDGTMAIVETYRERHPGVFRVMEREGGTGGAKRNFLDMIIRQKDDYVMLCDQDDVWLPDKIALSLGKIREMEREYGVETPLLVHTDLRVVDEEFNLINPSFRAAMNANYDKTALRQQLIQNTLTGCTAIFNRALSALIDREPPYCVMHDWWLMLVCAAFGHIDWIDAQTVLYRQHRRNEIGAKDVRTLSYKLKKLRDYPDMRRAIEETYVQAASLLSLYHDRLSPEQVSLLEAYCSIPSMNKLGRWRTICQLGVLKNGVARKLANFIFI